MKHNNGFGAIQSKIDLRDYKIKALDKVEIIEFELDNLPKVKNQFSVGSCVAHVLSSILEWYNIKELNEYRELSTGFIYGMQGIICDRIERGMYLRDGCKIIHEYGDCLRDSIPFNIEMPKCYEKLTENLTEEIYAEAKISKIKSYARCETDNDIKQALINYGPILMSIKWYSKYKLQNGTIFFNTNSAESQHAIMVYGFNETGWLCQNSWGTLWGNKGRFILPYGHGFSEAWSFIDQNNEDIYKPAQNKLLDIVYKVLNFILNNLKRK